MSQKGCLASITDGATRFTPDVPDGTIERGAGGFTFVVPPGKLSTRWCAKCQRPICYGKVLGWALAKRSGRSTENVQGWLT
jgi:hypothetical protein